MTTIARLLASVGPVERKRPKSSFVPFAHSTVMAIWQLDIFEFSTFSEQVVTNHQFLDDATRFDVGSSVYGRHEDSDDSHNRCLRSTLAET